MQRKIFSILCFFLILQGCAGYSTQTKLPNDIQSIYVPSIRNLIPLENMLIHVPGMENDITNAVIARFKFDGTLKVVNRKENADATLYIDLTNFDQSGTRFTNLESVEEYRLFITTTVQLKDNGTNESLIHEGSFRGETSYFRQFSRFASRDSERVREPITQPLRDATVRAVQDYARNVVDLVTEAW